MNDEQIQILISAYLDGEVTLDEKKEVEEFLRDPKWQKYYQQLKTLSQALKTMPDEALSLDVEVKINQSLDTGKKEREMKPRNRLISFGVGSSLVIVLVLTLFISNTTKQVMQGHLKNASDDIGDQFAPGNTLVQKTRQMQPTSQRSVQELARAPLKESKKMAKGEGGTQYEPYYLSSDYSMVQEGNESQVLVGAGESGTIVSVAGDSSHRRDTAGFQQSVDVASDMPRRYNPAPVAAPMIEGFSQQEYWGTPTRPIEEGNTEDYDRIYENEFKTVSENPLSTFSIDVDTASYANLRRYLTANQMPPKDSVRIEEMINYFDYQYPNPKKDEPFSITTEVVGCPWNSQHQLALIGLQGKRLEKLPPSNLVFLIDVSGSMAQANKLQLLQSAFRLMVPQLESNDRVSIVVYAGAAGVVLDSTAGDQTQMIQSAIDRLQAGGSTAGGQGIKLAYEIATKNFIDGGNNRVILATDGDFNVGVSSDSELVRMIEERRDQGIYLTVLGFGMGNYKDNKMEKLADKGNGNYFYIDTLNEGRKVLVNELGSTIFAIAKDVKIQVEFNPAAVKAYRLVGYENRMLAKEDFNDDTKDAGEIGAGHTVTALYEIVPVGSQEEFAKVDDLKYQKTTVGKSDEVMTVKLRYKEPDSSTSQLITRTVTNNQVTENPSSDNFRLASAVAEFGLLLRDSENKAQANYDHVITEVKQTLNQDKFGYRAELLKLVETARMLNPYPGSKKMQK